MSPVALAGKVAAVTGASRGLGRRICEAFAEAGMAVAMLSRTGSALTAAAAEIGPAAAAFATDISKPEARPKASVNSSLTSIRVESRADSRASRLA